MLIKYGEFNNVIDVYAKHLVCEAEDEGSLKILEVTSDKGLKTEHILYIIKRAHCYSLSGFIQEVGIRWNDEDFPIWLKNEMEKKPV